MGYRRRKDQLSLSKIFIYLGKPGFLIVKLFAILLYQLTRLLQNIGRRTLKIFHSRPHKKVIKKPNPRLSKILKLGFSLLLLLILPLSLLVYPFLRSLPSPHLLTTTPPALATKILDRHGNLLYSIYKDENRSLIRLSELPPHLIQATLAAEDKNFYSHFGLDLSGILRATINNLTCRLKLRSCSASPQGGSTITQQLIKNTLLTSEKTLTRKIKEAVLALQTERLYSKDTILEMYFNQVPYGGVAFGIEEAAQTYFGKSARDINLSESAFLAGLPIAPTLLSPYGTTPYLAKIRQQQVLENMVNANLITENEKVTAVNQPLNLKSPGVKLIAPHFVMYVRSLLVELYGESTVNQGGLTVTTTLDQSLQTLLETQINTELNSLSRLNVKNGAGLILAPQTGEILSMVGSRDFFDTAHDGQVNLTLQSRQPGSAIKPLTYALAFLRGLNPSSLIEDAPICFPQTGSEPYCPKNYDGKFHGTITLKSALANSYNIPAVKLLSGLGVSNLIELAQQLGITTWNNPERFGLALTLGGGEIRMLDLAQAYAVFANSGTKVALTPLLSVTTHTGESLPLPKQEPIPLLPESVAFQINQSLSDNAARSAAFGTRSILNLKNHVVAVKTGTTNNLRDNWTFGYTQKYLVATWVGNNDNTPMSQVTSGITGASPIWSRTMQELLKIDDSPAWSPPPTLVRARTSCETNYYDYFPAGKEPRLNCTEPNTGQIL